MANNEKPARGEGETKFALLKGVLGVGAGLVVIRTGWVMDQHLRAGAPISSQPSGLIVAALGVFLLVVGLGRIWLGLRAKKKP
ncbi:MAG: hypothetical protein N3D11_08080 [Candidatus Sumerlaeia bacterium]|nr:hypothetical protein [Candidatus Sumerlaeia bacterium]